MKFYRPARRARRVASIAAEAEFRGATKADTGISVLRTRPRVGAHAKILNRLAR
jgi:hypothetical protein